ncbi:GNAT family N-acetyltransferase [Saccharopolyspora rhizosphaerae]|uniref:GNAT family N-acetyltransferase n=1 Tax=Saccharopolyspora rhizosphaerae TaxID=2492662 RepID=A0A3R8P670_9PSEU|nr:GNAT family N-acetyltransferase [Saccharopolyspora rhizosphaerae]
MRIVVDDLTGPEIEAFLQGHISEMRAVSPPGSTHALELKSLRRPGVTFWSAREGGVVLGCGAIKEIDLEHAEVKSMRTDPSHKNRGIASQLLNHIIAESKLMGYTRLSLETGASDFFEPARRLYLKHGFSYCEPFAEYREDPHSLFMTRTL